MKFWWTTIKEQRKEIKILKDNLRVCHQNQYHKLKEVNELSEISKALTEISKKPTEVKKVIYTVDAIEFARQLQGNKKQIDEARPNRFNYVIPSSRIDRIAIKLPIETND